MDYSEVHIFDNYNSWSVVLEELIDLKEISILSISFFSFHKINFENFCLRCSLKYIGYTHFVDCIMMMGDKFQRNHATNNILNMIVKANFTFI